MVDGQGLREYMANGTFMRRDFREISENMERIATPSFYLRTGDNSLVLGYATQY